MKFIILISIVILLNSLANYRCKSEEKSTQGLLVGVQHWNSTFIEAGYLFGRQINWIESKKVKGYGGLGVSAEFGSPSGYDPVIGIKTSYTINMFISFGGSIIYYTDFARWSLRFRPEIGVSAFGLRLVYGRNSTMFKPDFPSIQPNTITFTLFVPM